MITWITEYYFGKDISVGQIMCIQSWNSLSSTFLLPPFRIKTPCNFNLGMEFPFWIKSINRGEGSRVLSSQQKFCNLEKFQLSFKQEAEGGTTWMWEAVELLPRCATRKKASVPAFSPVIIERFGLEGTFKDHLVRPPLPWAGTSFTRSGCSKTWPTWPWTLPGMGHP